MPAMTARKRWLIGGAAVLGAIAIVIVAYTVLSARPVPEALKYVPANSVAVAELRLDLPGDQLSRLGNLLAHFPGFQDQSTLAAKIDQSLDRLVRNASGGSVDYSTRLKPWLAGPAFVAVLPPAAARDPRASPDPTTFPAGRPDLVVVATTNGQVRCEDAITDGGAREDIGAAEQMLVSTDRLRACVRDGRFALLGTPSAVMAAYDTHQAGNGIDDDATYARARDTLGGDRLATLYVSGAAGGLMQAVASPGAELPLPSGLAGMLPAWTIAGLRAEDDALVADVVVAPASASATAAPTVPHPTMATLPPPRSSQVAAFVPGDAVLVAEVHGAGVAAQNALRALVEDPQFEAVAGQLGSALALAGGPEGVVGWIDDAAIVIIPRPGDAASAPGSLAVDGGLVLVAADDATAAAKAAQLKSVLSVAALAGGGSVNDESVEGGTVTTIDLGDLNALLGAAGGSVSAGGVTIPPGTRVTVSLATRGRLVLLGGDVGFGRAMLQVQAGATLADQAAYRRAIGRAAERNIVQVYVAGAALRELAGTMIPADELERWRTDVLPYVEPADALVLTSTFDGGLSRTRLVLTVITPAATPTGTP